MRGFPSTHFYSGKAVLPFYNAKPGTLPGRFIWSITGGINWFSRSLLQNVQYWLLGLQPGYIYQCSSSHLDITQRFLFSYVCNHYSWVFNPLLFSCSFCSSRCDACCLTPSMGHKLFCEYKERCDGALQLIMWNCLASTIAQIQLYKTLKYLEYLKINPPPAGSSLNHYHLA